MTTAIAAEASAPISDTYPPAPGQLIHQFIAKLAEFPRGQMAPSDNPAYVALLAKDQMKVIEKILDEASDYVKQGYTGARDIAKSYRTVYALFSAIQYLGNNRDYTEMLDLLQLGFFAGQPDADIRALAVSCNGLQPKERAALDTVPIEHLRTYLVEARIKSQPKIELALRFGTSNFDMAMLTKKLSGFADKMRSFSRSAPEQALSHIQHSALKYLGGAAALSWMGMISPEIALAGAMAGAGLSSGMHLLTDIPNLTRDQIAQLANGMGELTRVVSDLERAADEREAAERQPKRASR